LDDLEYIKLLTMFYENLEVISNIFDNQKGVMILCDNPDLRNNRLNLLGILRNYSLLVADFNMFNS